MFKFKMVHWVINTSELSTKNQTAGNLKKPRWYFTVSVTWKAKIFPNRHKTKEVLSSPTLTILV